MRPFYAARVLESLAAYGVDAGRLLRIEVGKLYRFANLFDVIDIMSDGMHPGVITAMQNGIDIPAGPRRRLTAVMRGSAEHRRIANADEIDAVLTQAEAVRIDPARAPPLRRRCRRFRDSDTIVADLGSNLAASIYARPQTGIVTIGPSGWDDYYFVHTFQRQQINHADIRGVAVPRESLAIGHAPYLVDPAHLTAGLEAVGPRVEPSAFPKAAGRLIAPRAGAARFGSSASAWTANAAGVPGGWFSRRPNRPGPGRSVHPACWKFPHSRSRARISGSRSSASATRPSRIWSAGRWASSSMMCCARISTWTT